MPFTYPEVTISAVDFSVYCDEVDAAAYLLGRLETTAWDDADPDTRAKALVTATRFLDRQAWQGTKTEAANDLEWPKTGVLYRDGSAVDDSELPQQLIDACVELALALLSDATIQEQTDNTGSNVASVGAGPAQVAFFRPTSGTRFPTIIDELIGQFLAGEVSATWGEVFGDDVEAESDSDDRFDFNDPLG